MLCDQALMLVSVLYALVLSALLLFKTLLYDLDPVFALLYTFAPYWFAPLAILLPLVLFFRTRVAILSLAITIMLFATQYGLLFIPKVQQNQPESSLKVLTFNLGPGQARPHQVLEAIRKHDADIVALQELTFYTAKLFREELVGEYPYMITTYRHTTALLSRYPILWNDWVYRPDMSRAFIHATIEWEEQQLQVLSAHPRAPMIDWGLNRRLPIRVPIPLPRGIYDKLTRMRIHQIADYAETLPAPVIIMGDFNTSSQTDAYTRMTETFVDAHFAAGYGFDFSFPNNLRISRYPVPMPFVKIDYIFHSRDFETLMSQTVCYEGSDHCLVYAELSLQIHNKSATMIK
ncbi:MAG: endonuclease/exonuclease/phosphatase family protein [Chloroflexota bacterium]